MWLKKQPKSSTARRGVEVRDGERGLATEPVGFVVGLLRDEGYIPAWQPGVWRDEVELLAWQSKGLKFVAKGWLGGRETVSRGRGAVRVGYIVRLLVACSG